MQSESAGDRDSPAEVRDVPELTRLRGNPAIAHYGLIGRETPRLLYEQLRRTGWTPRLDFVLATNGGTATAARRTALLLHDFTEHLTVLVPYRARSAGTMLCLGAHELVLGPLAELGPLDPHISPVGPPRPDGAGPVSAEEVRAFRRMAEDWFGATSEEHRVQVLALLAQRIMPTSLGAFYRADQLVREMADELLRYQLPDADQGYRDDLVQSLVSGYHGHDYAITRDQARKLGLRVTEPTPAEEELLWSLLDGARQRSEMLEGRPMPGGGAVPPGRPTQLRD